MPKRHVNVELLRIIAMSMLTAELDPWGQVCRVKGTQELSVIRCHALQHMYAALAAHNCEPAMPMQNASRFLCFKRHLVHGGERLPCDLPAVPRHAPEVVHVAGLQEGYVRLADGDVLGVGVLVLRRKGKTILIDCSLTRKHKAIVSSHSISAGRPARFSRQGGAGTAEAPSSTLDTQHAVQ